jgi:hypothetical protein
MTAKQALVGLAMAVASPVLAQDLTYSVFFTIRDIPAPVSEIFGNFVVRLDPETVPYVNDAVPDDLFVGTPLVGFDESFSRVDFFPFTVSDPGFLIGWESGGLDTNNTTLNFAYDYRVRFILNPDYSIVSARGVVRYFDGVGSYPFVGFDTSEDSGRIDFWSVTINGATPAIPEPATWSLMIAGFGLIGAAARRGSHPSATARHVTRVVG